jgi:hypothetical protein
VCPAVFISALEDLEVYRRTNCTIIAGSLVLRALSSHIDEDELAVFLSVRVVLGALVVSRNEHLTSLWFLSQLMTATSVELTSNMALVEATLPRLNPNVASRAAVNFNPRLCPALGPGGSVSLTAMQAEKGGSGSDTPVHKSVSCVPLELIVRVDATCLELAQPLVQAIASEAGLPSNLVSALWFMRARTCVCVCVCVRAGCVCMYVCACVYVRACVEATSSSKHVL